MLCRLHLNRTRQIAMNLLSAICSGKCEKLQKQPKNYYLQFDIVSNRHHTKKTYRKCEILIGSQAPGKFACWATFVHAASCIADAANKLVDVVLATVIVKKCVFIQVSSDITRNLQ